ncbi:MAG: hypothetical protein LBG92_08425, partial [Prevotellaceae bacterium]|nr:hypothetical protein [Prevotellaceae bacterium]
NIEHIDKQIEGLEFVFIELPKFKPKNRAEKKLHELWLRFLTEINGKTEKVPVELMECAETKEAVRYMEVGAYSHEQLQLYDKLRIAKMTAKSFVDDAIDEGLAKGLAKGLEEGIAKGLEEGIAKGLEEGIAKGLEEGRAEGIAKGLEEGRAEGIAKGLEEGEAERQKLQQELSDKDRELSEQARRIAELELLLNSTKE